MTVNIRGAKSHWVEPWVRLGLLYDHADRNSIVHGRLLDALKRGPLLKISLWRKLTVPKIIFRRANPTSLQTEVCLYCCAKCPNPLDTSVEYQSYTMVWAAAAEVFNSFLILRIVARLIWLNPIEQKNTVIERFGLFSVWMLRYIRKTSELNAAVAELVDAQRWGRCGVTPVEVRVFSAAPLSNISYS